MVTRVPTWISLALMFSCNSLPASAVPTQRDYLRHESVDSDHERDIYGPTATSRGPVTDTTKKAFDDFVARQKRAYQHGSSEYDRRLQLFQQRHAEMDAQNTRSDALWSAGINHFADRTDEELSQWRGRKGPRAGSRSGKSSYQAGAAFIEKQQPTESWPAPPGIIERLASAALHGMPRASPVDNSGTFNWKNLTMAGHVANQGACGSCWAMTAISVLEAHYEIHVDHQNPKKFSAQELVSCVPNPKHCGGKGGCDGATVELAMQYVMGSGLNTAQTAPYSAADRACDSVRPHAQQQGGISGGSSLAGLAATHHHGVGLTTFKTLPVNKEQPLVQALTELGPVAVSVAADKWHMYQSGIFNSCGKDCEVDHAVTMYGFGTEGDKKYWLIRNSWGGDWGEHGFVRLLRRDNEQAWCGVDNDPQKGVACDGDPTSVTVCGTCGVLYDSVVPCFPGSTSSLCQQGSENAAGAPGASSAPSGGGSAIETDVFEPEWLTALPTPIEPSSKLIRREQPLPL